MRWMFRLLGLVLVLLAFAIGAVFFLPKERIAAIASDQLRAQTGRELTVSDEVSLSIWPVLGVTTGPVTLSNADWAGDQPMMSADGLSIGVDARALLGGDIRIKHIEAQSPVVRLATRADGRGNWEFEVPAQGATTSDAQAAQASTRQFSLERLSLNDATLTYAAAGASPLKLSDLDARLDWPDPAGSAAFQLGFTYATAALNLKGEIGSFAAFLEGAVVPVVVSGDTSGGNFSFDGRASTSGEAAGRIDVQTRDTAAFLSGLGFGDVGPPAGLGRVADISGDLTFTTDNRLSLRDLSVELDQNRLQGAVDVVIADVPKVTASLIAGDLQLAGTSGESGGAAAPSTDDGWSKDPIDASALGLMNADIALTANSIDLGQIKLGPSDMTLTIDRSRAVVQIARVSVFDGTVSGQFVANNRNGLSVGGKLTASQIEIERMLTDMADITRLSGKTDGQIEFLGVGQSVDSIMRSLSGQGSFAVGRGLISGIDLDAVMRSGISSGGTTVFDSLTAGFTIQNGNLQNDDLLLLLSNFRAEGAGRVGLGARDIDYLFTPIALRANSGQGLAIPVRIRGPWSNPRISPDLSEALQLDADGKVEEVKQEAQQKLDQKLQEELGVTVQDGQSTEDALKDALEDQVKNKLLELLGGGN